MMYVNNPNLPVNAKIVLMGEKYRFLVDTLRDNGLDTILVPNNPNVDERLSSHADLSIVLVSPKTIYMAKYLENSDFSRELEVLGFDIIIPDIYQCKLYPEDCQFNICSWSKYLLYNEKTADKEVISGFLNSRDIIQLKCKQGYCKCLVAVVDSNSIITSDPGIAKICAEQGIDVLKIEAGHIDLDGFEYGFIGGAAFKASKDTMIFTGSLDAHPNKEDILNFLSARNIKLKFLSDKKIFDVGSILPIIEK